MLTRLIAVTANVYMTVRKLEKMPAQKIALIAPLIFTKVVQMNVQSIFLAGLKENPRNARSVCIMLVNLLLIPAKETFYSEEMWDETFQQSFQRIFTQAEKFGVTVAPVGNRHTSKRGLMEEFFLAGAAVQEFLKSIKETSI
ncbi:hypothetical protein LR013_00875 [candidate division NPL-UPA2 bacterium]|nr:hypothetical protein [candidate division NPL-UPA2 bacterium]